MDTASLLRWLRACGMRGAGGAGWGGAADRGARVHMLSGLLSRPSCETGCLRTCGTRRSRSLPRAQSSRSSSNSIWSLSGSSAMRRWPPLRRALAAQPAARACARRAGRSEITEQRAMPPAPEPPQQRSAGGLSVLSLSLINAGFHAGFSDQSCADETCHTLATAGLAGVLRGSARAHSDSRRATPTASPNGALCA